VRFSEGVSSPPRGFFFRVAGFRDRRLVPLKPGVLVQHRVRREGDGFLVGNLLVVRLADIRVAQEPDAVAPRVRDDDVLVGVRLLLAAVVRGLFFSVFRPLAPPLRAIDDQPRPPAGSRFAAASVAPCSTTVPASSPARDVAVTERSASDARSTSPGVGPTGGTVAAAAM